MVTMVRTLVAFFLALISVTSSVFVSAVSPAWAGHSVWSQVGGDINGEAAEDSSGRPVSFSSDGSRVAIGAPYNTGDGLGTAGHVRVFELNNSGAWVQLGSDINGEASGDLSGTSVSLSSDGSRVAIGAMSNSGGGLYSGHVRVYELIEGAWVQKGGDINGESHGDNSGRSVSLSSDGSRVAIGAPGNDGGGPNAGQVRVYELIEGAWVQKGSDIDGEAAGDALGYSVSLSSSGFRVAIGAPDNSGGAGHVRVYELSVGAWVQVGSDIDGEAAEDWSGLSVSLSSDGSHVAIGASRNSGGGSDAGHVRVHELTSGAWVQVGSDIDGGAGDSSGAAVSLSSDGSRVAIGANNNSNDAGQWAGHVRVYDLTVGPMVETYFSSIDVKTGVPSSVNYGCGGNIDPPEQPGSLAFSPDGKTAYIANANDAVCVLSVKNSARLNDIVVGDNPVSVAFSKDGKTAYVANSGSDTLSVINVKTGTVRGTPIGVGDNPVSVAFSPDGKTAYVANAGSDTLSVIDVKTGVVRGDPISVGDNPVSVAFNKDGKTAYVANAGSDTLSVIDVKTGTVRGSPISVGDNPVSVAFSPDGKTAYVANAGADTLSVIDVKTGTVRGSPISVGDNPVSVAFSKDGKTAHFLFYDDYVPPPT